MSKLTLRYEYDRSFFDASAIKDDFGRLSVDVETDRISVRGGFWVQWQDVVELGEDMHAFPITDGAPIRAQWGFDQQEGDDLILLLEITPADRRGNLKVRFEVADDYDPSVRARGYFTTNYRDVEKFRVGIAHLMARETTEAMLVGQ
ncbi:hypothetical protein [Sphingomonas sp. RS2018]